jgi:hypothetical protein
VLNRGYVSNILNSLGKVISRWDSGKEYVYKYLNPNNDECFERSLAGRML